eukprot:4485640-Prymnesium_polylepis.3
MWHWDLGDRRQSTESRVGAQGESFGECLRINSTQSLRRSEFSTAFTRWEWARPETREIQSGRLRSFCGCTHVSLTTRTCDDDTPSPARRLRTDSAVLRQSIHRRGLLDGLFRGG